MRTFARVHDGRVVELFATDEDIGTLFHPSLRWIDVTDRPDIRVGWHHDGLVATAPAMMMAEPEPEPTIAELRLAFAQLEARLRRLAGD